MSDSSLTPMMRQYHATRRELPPNTLLLFRLGDFFEMFFEDAKEASAILNVALTKRGTTPMCGVPFHSSKTYIARLIAAGKKVAICDQVGEVQAGKLVRRELTQIISAGTLDDFGLEEGANNYLAAVRQSGERFGLAFADLSTGEFRVSEPCNFDALLDEIARIAPAEIIAPEEQAARFAALGQITPVEGYVFETDSALPLLLDHFRVQSLDGFGCTDLAAGVGAAGGLLHYLTRQLRRNAGHLRRLQTHRPGEFLVLDAATQSHLELVNSRGGKAMTLLAALDRSVTPMGARTLRGWVLNPLRGEAPIRARQDAIAALLADALHLGDLRESLAGIRDIERAASRLSGPSGNARDLAVIASSLAQIPALRTRIDSIGGDPDSLLADLASRLHPLPGLASALDSALTDEPPANLRDGGIIRDGFDPALDELRAASREGKDWIAGLQEKEIERTGIKSLKVRFNSVFGYFIEITKANLGAVPEDYHRKQTTANGERFITPGLKEIEGKILGAEERAKALEAEIFGRLRAHVLGELPPLQESASSLGAIDALASLAETARLYSYCRPEISGDGGLFIEGGRHPVLDQREGGERFVPNDTGLDLGRQRFAIITGPNMAGKSTYIRQVALLTLMAQTGSFIPATSARIGVADRIFTRVGANDDLARGQSTFMVEMNETANIINNATARSLVILDEIGRGTSTFDGLSIAWSVAEHLHDRIGCRTLFATHYHELTDLERTREGIFNLSIAVREWNDQVIFLRKIIAGRADQSYGIQVARLAGLPDSIIARAREILSNLEGSELNAEGKPALAARRKGTPPAKDSPQLALFDPA